MYNRLRQKKKMEKENNIINVKVITLFSPNFILIYFCVHFLFGHYVTTYIMLVSDGHMTTAKADHHVFSSVVL